MPAVSVLMPCRNAEPFLAEAIDSVRAQTFTGLEVIAVDDGSTDETFARLYEWAQVDGRVRVLQVNGRGLVAALATGLAAARGEIVARMDADDIAEPTRLERQVGLMRADPGLAACGTHVRYFPESEVRNGARRYERWLNSVTSASEIRRDIFIECPIPHPTLMVRRNVLAGVGGYREMGWPEDYDLVLRIWAGGYRMSKVPEVLYHWRERPDRASRTEPRYQADRFRDVKIHFLQRTLLAGGRQAVVWGAGPLGKAFARRLAEAGTSVAAFVELAPRKIGQEIHGAPVIAPERVGELAGATSSDQALVLAVVGQDGAREEIRTACRQLGLVEGEDFVAVA